MESEISLLAYLPDHQAAHFKTMISRSGELWGTPQILFSINNKLFGSESVETVGKLVSQYPSRVDFFLGVRVESHLAS